MIQFYKIWANARYEITTLLRGWFFRIFAGLSIALLITINIIFFSNALPVPRLMKGFSSSIPYANMLLLNIAQMAIIIFMASDFYKRDRKFNTTEVFYIRSMTNANYLFGKALGVFILFLGLTLIVLIMAAFIHLLFSDTNFNWLPYVLYPLLIGFPSFIFMIGLSFLMMRLIKNQAVVVLALLGYYAATLFYLFDKWYYIFDFLAMLLPMIHSDFAGFVNFELVLMQRGFYVFIGITFLLLSILFFHRLSQSQSVRRLVILLTVLSSFLSILCAGKFLHVHLEQKESRIRMISLNQSYLDKPNITPLFCRIELVHYEEHLKSNALFVLSNKTNIPLHQFYFSINPGLKVSDVQYKGHSVDFKQFDHIIDIKVDTALEIGDIDSVMITYAGFIDEAVCYLDINEDQRETPHNYWLYRIPKKYAYLTDNYVLLSPECLWYPKAGLPQGTRFPHQMAKQFIRYELTVSTKTDLSAISQGKMTSLGEGRYLFRPEFPLENISLVIGSYQKKSVTVDSVEYNLYAFPGHNYYEQYFTEIGDTLGEIIKEVKQDYEVRLDLEYPYKRLSLIEVPIQFYAYPRIWTLAQEVLQPEQIWIQENAAILESADFKRSKRSMERRLDRSNQTLTERESQISILKIFLNKTFCGKSIRRFITGGPGVNYNPDYNLFPNYYAFVTNLYAKRWEILDLALQAYLYDRISSSEENVPQWYMEGLSQAEEVSQALHNKSLAEHLGSPERGEFLPEMIRLKGSFIIKLLQNEFGTETFEKKLTRVCQENRFKNLNLNTFISALNLDRDFNLETSLENWYNSKSIPAFQLSNIDLFKVLDKDRIRSQIVFTITNPEMIDGLIEVSFRYSRRGRGMPFGSEDSEEPPRLYLVQPEQTKEIGILLDDEPRTLNINFLIARNLPLVYSKQFEKAELEEQRKPFDGEKILETSISFIQSGELIVDNEDPGFEPFNPPFKSILKQMIHGEQIVETEKKYDRFQWWRPPHQWTLIKNASFFGEYIHSAYYIRPGDGQKYVTWRTEFEQDDFYDVYAYMFSKEGFWRGRGGRRGMTFGDFNYRVYHDAGIDKITLDADDAEEGWNFLGTWYFSAGEAKVQLTDQSNGRVVIADAIKWIKN